MTGRTIRTTAYLKGSNERRAAHRRHVPTTAIPPIALRAGILIYALAIVVPAYAQAPRLPEIVVGDWCYFGG
jgi:hypothetical protein